MRNLFIIVKAILKISIMCFPVAVFAQEFGENDYRLIFDIHRSDIDEVIREDGVIVRTLVLPGQVIITEYESAGEVKYVAEDHGEPSGHLCLLSIFLSTQRALDRCTDVGTDAQNMRLEDMIGRLSTYIADNTIPKYPIEKLRLELNQQREESRQQARECSLFGGYDERFVEHLLSDELYFSFDEILAVPKLPVITFCGL